MHLCVLFFTPSVFLCCFVHLETSHDRDTRLSGTEMLPISTAPFSSAATLLLLRSLVSEENEDTEAGRPLTGGGG